MNYYCCYYHFFADSDIVVDIGGNWTSLIIPLHVMARNPLIDKPLFMRQRTNNEQEKKKDRKEKKNGKVNKKPEKGFLKKESQSRNRLGLVCSKTVVLYRPLVFRVQQIGHICCFGMVNYAT